MSLRHITDYAKAARAGARIASNPKLKADLLELAKHIEQKEITWNRRATMQKQGERNG